MSQEILVTASLQYTNTAKNISAKLAQIAGSLFDIAGQNYEWGTKSFPTTAGGVAIPVSNLASLGLAIFINHDTTNFVKLMTAVSGTVFGKLKPGEAALFRFDASVTAPAIISDTGACEVEFLILEN